MRYLSNFLYILVFLVVSQETWAKDNCSTESLELKENQFQVQISKVQSSNPNQKSILIVPPTGGTNFIDHSYGKSFCENGFDVYILDRWTDDDEYSLDLLIHERFYSRAQSAIKITLSHISSPFIGILGTSVGAIHAANAISQSSKLNATFLIAGGAPIPEVIANSDQDILIQARLNRFRTFRFKDMSEYIHALAQSLTFDPIKGSAYQNASIGMVIANSDTTVPIKNQLDLQKVLNPEKVIRIDGNHVYSIVKTWLCYKNEIIQFFKIANLRLMKNKGESP